jgi:hypothetical protein
MDDINIFIIGIFVFILFAIGVFHTVIEFKEMYSGEEQDVPRDKKIELDK